MGKLRAVLAGLTDDQVLALFRAVGQWTDNELSRDDGETTPDAVTLEPVVDKLTAAFVDTVGA